MRCRMCNIWQHPTDRNDEIKASDLRSLPRLKFINLTGGEPFVRDDIEEIVEECYRHTKRIVISTSGWYYSKVIELAKRFPDIGIRLSLEGMQAVNDELRGRSGGFEKGFNTLLTLRDMGVKDIGFGCTVSDTNSEDMLQLYRLSRVLGLEFATAAYHNSFYFHKEDNMINDPDKVCADFYKLVQLQLKERRPKSWFRAYFNMGLINYVRGNRRLLPCEAGSVNFFIDPHGEVYPCNGMECRYWKASMGNIRSESFDALWGSAQAMRVREQVSRCPKNCWMVGTVSPVMHRHLYKPLRWVVKNKLRSVLNQDPSMACPR